MPSNPRAHRPTRRPSGGTGGPQKGPRAGVTYRLDLEYEGTRYRGWQIQHNATTVAGVLTRAFEEADAGLLELGGAGRTDAGVHALHQVAHARLRAPIDPARLRFELADRLPYDVVIRSLEPASPRFHARHDATSRAYLYQISRRRTAFGKRLVWWIRDALDAEAMQRAATAVAGRHDFARFCVAPAQQGSTLVEVESCELVEDGDLILVRIVASHFLWRMVRRVVGFLVEVGCGRLPAGSLEAVLSGDAPDIDPAAFTAPPSGLFLERVSYEGDTPIGPIRGVLRT